MSTELERRVEALESEIKSLKTRVEIIDQDVQDIPGAINAGFRLVDSRFARVMTEIADLRRAMDQRFDATLRAIAEMIAKK
jgi:predicted  nucleic acid-binding Zn-ribbon protein